MGRITRKGIDYFNIDCHQEDKLTLVEAIHGIEGYGVVVKIWKKIYQLHGYYCEWDEKNVFLFAKDVNVPVEKLKAIVKTCLEEEIFSQVKFDQLKILTSSGVQKRWKKIVTDAKRKDVEIETKFNLLLITLDDKPKTPEDNEKTPSDGTQRKEKESIIDESIIEPKGSPAGEPAPTSPNDQSFLRDEYKKLTKTKGWICGFIKDNKPLFIEPYFDLWNLFAKEKTMSQVIKITDSRKKKFHLRVKDDHFDFIEILRMAGLSNFILTNNWFNWDYIFENDTNYMKVIEGKFSNDKDPQDKQNEIKSATDRAEQGLKNAKKYERTSQ